MKLSGELSKKEALCLFFVRMYLSRTGPCDFFVFRLSRRFQNWKSIFSIGVLVLYCRATEKNFSKDLLWDLPFYLLLVQHIYARKINVIIYTLKWITVLLGSVPFQWNLRTEEVLRVGCFPTDTSSHKLGKHSDACLQLCDFYNAGKRIPRSSKFFAFLLQV